MKQTGIIEVGQYQGNAVSCPPSHTRRVEISTDNWRDVHEAQMIGIDDPWCKSEYGFSNVQYIGGEYTFVHTQSTCYVS